MFDEMIVFLLGKAKKDYEASRALLRLWNAVTWTKLTEGIEPPELDKLALALDELPG